jgi:hypothetical protein
LRLGGGGEACRPEKMGLKAPLAVMLRDTYRHTIKKIIERKAKYRPHKMH